MFIGTFAQDPIGDTAQDEAGSGARTAVAIFATNIEVILGLHQNLLL